MNVCSQWRRSAAILTHTAWLALAALALAGCSMLDAVYSTSAVPASAGPLPSYRRVAAHELKGILGDPAQAGLLDISAPTVVDAIKGPSWLTCIRANGQAQPRYYAVFIQGEKVVDSRVAVVLDRCEQQPYSAFAWQDELKNTRN